MAPSNGWWRPKQHTLNTTKQCNASFASFTITVLLYSKGVRKCFWRSTWPFGVFIQHHFNPKCSLLLNIWDKNEKTVITVACLHCWAVCVGGGLCIAVIIKNARWNPFCSDEMKLYMRCLYGVSAFCLSVLQPPYVSSCLSVAHTDNLCYFAYQWRMYSDAFIGTCSGTDQLLGHVNETCQQLVHAVQYITWSTYCRRWGAVITRLLFCQLFLFLLVHRAETIEYIRAVAWKKVFKCFTFSSFMSCFDAVELFSVCLHSA